MWFSTPRRLHVAIVSLFTAAIYQKSVTNLVDFNESAMSFFKFCAVRPSQLRVSQKRVTCQGCKRDVAVQDRDRDLPKFSRDRGETETFDFGSEAEIETFRTEIKTFSRPLYIPGNCRPLCFFQSYHDDDQFNALILYKWNKQHKSSWHCLEFTHHIFSNQIGQLSLTSTSPKLE